MVGRSNSVAGLDTDYWNFGVAKKQGGIPRYRFPGEHRPAAFELDGITLAVPGTAKYDGNMTVI